jgi:putative membrane protein insertion efficiency factor
MPDRVKLIPCLLLVYALARPGWAQMGEEKPPQTKPEAAEEDMDFAFRIYEELISPVDGERCRMHPSCSQYSKDAITKTGIFQGILMTADRIMRCGMDTDFYRTYSIGEQDLYEDPVP